ncbi:hypothetical protein EJ08DRAFT_653348 [Tothia fuscella]|uniref:DUF7730 domain-containing protein n=1 Tax=Tothia fuscella TaxID=1048955 RepID=A0A9P4NHZ0_9PEZI|nr:hypothetical protein EJ08DRAFT_653348 [Tothia fuscella]
MLQSTQRSENFWAYAHRPDVPFKWHGPARHHDWEAAEREQEEARRKAKSIFTNARGKVHIIWADVKGITSNLPRPNINSLHTHALFTSGSIQFQSTFFSKLPVELRQKIYTYVLLDYPNTVYIFAGAENGSPSRDLFHTPCITPPTLEVPSWWCFQNSRWGVGIWGSYHLYCDLAASKVSQFHSYVTCGDMCRPLGEPRTVYEVVCDTQKKYQGKAPFLPLLLTCHQIHDEAIRIIYSSLTISFIGERSLSLFTLKVDHSLIRSLQLIHLVWPSWWKPHSWFRWTAGKVRRYEFWYPPEPEPSVAKAEWEELWRLFSQMGPVKRLYVTIFQTCSITKRSDGSIDLYHAHRVGDQENVISIDKLLPALHSVRADEFFVEVYAEKESVEEPSANRPFRLHYNPALGRL